MSPNMPVSGHAATSCVLGRKTRLTRRGGLFVMAGGGTGGHVIPAIAVAREVCRMGYRVLFVGTERGVENRLVPAAGFPTGKNPRRRNQEPRACHPRCRVCGGWSRETIRADRALPGLEARGGLQHGRLCCRSAGTGGAAARRARGRDGTERGARVHESLDRAMGEARADQLRGDGAVLPGGPDGVDRIAGARRVFRICRARPKGRSLRC